MAVGTPSSRTISEINSLIEAVLLLVREDIEKITALLKNRNSSRTGDAQNISEIISRAQSLDAFEQKSKHTIAVNTTVQNFNWTSTQKQVREGNIFDLNHLQYSAAWNEYLQTIEPMDVLVKDLWGTENEYSHDLLTSRAIITSAVGRVGVRFQELAGATRTDGSYNTALHLTTLTALYSTDSERRVLEKFLLKPDITVHDLGQPDSQNQFSSIDLF
jgi:hypothetical protein